jgi:two-component system LytT family sensor kinase
MARHVAFYFGCYIFFCIAYYIPGAVLPAWSFEGFAQRSGRLGFPTWLKWRVVNSTLIFLPCLAFAYSIIYFILPRHYFNKKNLANTIILFSGILVLIFVVHYLFVSLVEWNNQRLNPANQARKPAARIIFVIRGSLFIFPIIAGFAVIIKMMKSSWLKQQETLHVAREKAKAELQLLKSQIHPHFLFNTLNNVYFLTLTASEKAPEMLVKLTDMLRYILNECNQSYVPLEKEIKMIEDYVALEKIRYGDRLKLELEIKGDYKNKMISPLLLIPLVENSFKHGASKMLQHPWVNLNITIEEQYLFFLLSNSRPEEAILPQHNGHIGLNNVKKRLQLLYPEAHELSIVNGADSYEVFMKITLGKASEISDEIEIKKESVSYELA